MSKHLIFVYGTLRRGGVRAMPGLFPHSKFVGQAHVAGGLYDMGEYPALLLGGSSSPVRGEVYEIDDKILSELDEIEASSLYRRLQVEVVVGDEKMLCWVYVGDSELCPQGVLITSGDWIEHAGSKNETD
jgi:gamma-glutamylcyclotransferase (GGCT)/AIG2-like uncharacterized protein YtfP